MEYTFQLHIGYVQYYFYRYSYIIMYLYVRIQTFEIYFLWHDSHGSGLHHSRGLTITLRHTTLGRTTLEQ